MVLCCVMRSYSDPGTFELREFFVTGGSHQALGCAHLRARKLSPKSLHAEHRAGQLWHGGYTATCELHLALVRDMNPDRGIAWKGTRGENLQDFAGSQPEPPFPGVHCQDSVGEDYVVCASRREVFQPGSELQEGCILPGYTSMSV